MLNFFEAFQKYSVPENLKEEVLSVDGEKLAIINHFSKLNIFVGPNNSGKSKLIRDIIRRGPNRYYSDQNWKKIQSLITQFFEEVDKKLREEFAADHFVIRNNSNGQIISTEEMQISKSLFLKYTENYEINQLISYVANSLVNLPTINWSSIFHMAIKGQHGNFNLQQDKVQNLAEKCKEISEMAKQFIERISAYEFPDAALDISIPRIYIPSVRTLRLFGVQVNVKEQTKLEYGFGNDIIIYNGQDLPNQVFDFITTNYENRKKLTNFERLLSKQFFDSKDVKLTYHKEDKVLLIKIGDEKERPIHQLGDGLQMIIIMTFPFFAYNSGIVAIEEPELFIHPGLQKTFMKFLTSHEQTKNFQVLIASHSNHILDAVNESDNVSVFSVKKQEKKNDNSDEKVPDFIIENVSYGNENLLHLLGITSTSVYLANCTVWVEGVTDKIYLQKFIEAYLESLDPSSKYRRCLKFKEGVNYSFVLSGGDSIIHWDFSDDHDYDAYTKKIIARKFCSKSLVIVDSDFGKNPARKKALSDLLGQRFVELELPEIENYLSSEVITKTILTYPTVSTSVAGSDLPALTKETLLSKKLGYIIDKVLLIDYPKAKTYSATDSENSSLRSGDKFVFCIRAVEFIEPTTMTEESKKLVEKILDFIIERNPAF